MQDWIFLLLAIVFETFGTAMLKASEQLTALLPAACSAAGYLLSFYFLAQALRTIPVGIAYAIWGGVGIVLILAIGAVAFRQLPDLPAVVGVALIIAGILVIRLFSKMQA